MMPVLWSIAAGQTVTTRSPEFILKPNRPIRASPIRVQEPQLVEGVTTVVTDSLFRVKGQYTGSGSILGGTVNDIPLTPGTGSGFGFAVPLKRGVNELHITLRTSEARTHTRAISVIYDTAPPAIEVLEPRQEDVRGMRLRETEVTHLRARVYDESGIYYVAIDGVQVPVNPDSTVSKDYAKLKGGTTARIVATDNAGYTYERDVPVGYGAGQPPLELMNLRNHALIIGIDQYKGQWPPLRNAVRDAKEVENLLRQRFRFESYTALYNADATRARILEEIEKLAEELGPEENLLVYYAGHGDWKEQFNAGYWVPVDAEKRMSAQYIANADIIRMIGGMKARHVLVVADACFAGDLVRGAEEQQPLNKTQSYYEEEARRMSRKALTSGAKEEVQDGGRQGHSIFAYYFMQALREIERDYFDASDVYARVKTAVGMDARQIPQLERLQVAGNEGGEFIFVRK